ncbi:MAG: SecDF P1 head subdomain-containing protein [Deltaproteobacteria bacterium]
MNRRPAYQLIRIVAILLFAGSTAVPVRSWDGPPDDGKAAAAKIPPVAGTLEEVAGRLKKIEGVEVALRPSKTGISFEARRDIAVKSRNWDKTLSTTFFVIPSLPTDKVGAPPADFTGSLAVEVIATDGHYSVVAGSAYDPETAKQICTAAGLSLPNEAESRRLKHSAASWLDFRLAVARMSDPEPEAPRPLAHGPSPAQIADYTKLFMEQGYNGGRRRGDPYLWFPVLGCCEVSPVLVTTADRSASYVLLSDKPDEVLLSGSKHPRPWHLKRVEAVRDAQGRPAVELEFDDAAAARIARLTEANPGRALALLMDDRVVQIVIIQGKVEKLVVYGKEFDEKTVAGMVRVLRECMVEPAAETDGSGSKNPRAADGTPGVELKAVEQSLKPILETLDPKAKIESRDQSLVVTYLAQTFKIHGRNKSGAISEKTHDVVGPGFKGFVLQAHLQPLGEVHQPVTPQTIREPYWLTDLDVTPIGKTDKQIYWALSYGSQTDKELLDKIRRQLRALKDLPANR